MNWPLSEKQLKGFLADGYLRLHGAAMRELPALEAAVAALLDRFPYGFSDPKYYSGNMPRPLTKETARPTGRILIPYAGFLDYRILAPLANPLLHDLLEEVVGRGFYLSNTWYQEVPPETPRLAYHKDPRGSITFNILLDEIAPGMGSTCLVPGTHINTPPARYCFSDLHERHPREVDLTGNRGDIVLFSTETWHGRSKNESTCRTRRLFYNFYSRSSRDTTAWAGIVPSAEIKAAQCVVPKEYWHMFDIDPARTRVLAEIDGTILRRWAYAKSGADEFWRDLAYAYFAYGRSSENPKVAGGRLPYSTMLTEARRFSLMEYLAHLRLMPSLKSIYGFCRRKLTTLRLDAVAAATPDNT